MNKPPIVEITWRDAFGRDDWHNVEEHADDYLIQTIGYLLWENEHYFGTGASFHADYAKVGNTTHIPKKCIMSIKFLRGKR